LAEEYVKPEQVAEEYHVTLGTLSNWRYRGRGPKYVKVGSLVRYRRSDLDRWAADNTRNSTDRTVRSA
jgi:predicted DNA-binding transcriptional regulator AlpA